MNPSPRGARALGYRVLGPAFDYILHLRPAEWPIMAGHTLLGAVLALGIRGFVGGEELGAVLLGLGLWVVALNGGTLAINSAFDQDEGDVAYLRQPPPPPSGLFAFGLGLMLAGLALAVAFLPIRYAALYLTCLVMSALYSVPPARLKAVAGADWVINMVGFGTLTPLAGWASTGRPLTHWGLLVALGFGALFAGLYPLTQLYQFEEDQRRGDRTFALVVGRRASLIIAIACVLLAFGIFFWAAWPLFSWPLFSWPLPRPLFSLVALLAALLSWMLVLLPWARKVNEMPPAAHQRGMHRALAAWAVTDVAVLVAWG